MICLLAVASVLANLSPTPYCGILWFSHSHPFHRWLVPYLPGGSARLSTSPRVPVAYSTAAISLRLGFSWSYTAAVSSCLPKASPRLGWPHVGRDASSSPPWGTSSLYLLFSFCTCGLFFCLGGPPKGFLMHSCGAFVLGFLSYLLEGARCCG